MESIVSKDPATGEVVGTVTATPVEQIATAVARAREAQPGWAALGLRGRADCIRGLAEAIDGKIDALSTLLSREMGKPLAEARGETHSCVSDLDAELDEMIDALSPEVIVSKHSRSTMYRDAFGVCAAITPWNFPIAMPHWMVVPALMAGNTVILKPSEETPLIAQAYVDALAPLLPANVLQIIHGDERQGRALVAADVDLIAFTGSREAGKQILGAAASGLKRVILELGGKDPLVVLSSADVGKAAAFAARNSFRNAGQVCVSTERIYVDKAIAPRFVEALIAEAKKFTVGNGLSDGTRVGPMINPRQRDHVLAQLDDAVAKGAVIAHRNGDPTDLFVPPVVLTGVTPAMDIATNETFGPVACVTTVSGDEEAIKLANDTPYGLGAVVFGADDDRTQACARRLSAGMIGINRGVGGGQGTPWVGAKESGYGFHGSRDGHRQFAQVRVVTTSTRT